MDFFQDFFLQIVLSIFSRCPAILEFIADWLCCCRAESCQECLELSQTTTERESEWEVEPWGGGEKRRKQMCVCSSVVDCIQ